VCHLLSSELLHKIERIVYHAAVVNVKEELSGDVWRTPWGWVGAAFTPRGLCRVSLPRAGRAAAVAALGLPQSVRFAPHAPWRAALRAFLRGGGEFAGVPVDLAGVEGFTRRVLEVVRALPRGATITYAELARRAGSPRACRAAGQALARNPVPLVIPCHRVVAAAGAGGYAGGVAMKLRLLALESAPGAAGRRRS
jgi:methylated-DNA-[protein]-cysteine S-methyltransferase